MSEQEAAAPQPKLPLTPSVFVALEGVPGSGKTTLQQGLCHFLEERTGRQTSILADPVSSMSPLAELITKTRESHNDLTGLEMGLLYTANRLRLSAHICSILNSGWNALLDRWTLSTVVFQGTDRVSAARIAGVTTLLNIVQPDLWIILDLPYFVWEERRKEREKTREARRVDQIGQARYDMLRRRYYEIGGFNFDSDDPEPMLFSEQRGVALINGSEPYDVVLKSAKQAIESTLTKASTTEKEVSCA